MGELEATTVQPVPAPPFVRMAAVQGAVLVTLKEAGRLLACSKKTIERERQRGNLRCRRMGGRWKVEVTELHRYIKTLKTS